MGFIHLRHTRNFRSLFIEETMLTNYGEVGDNVPTSQRCARLVNEEVMR